MPFFNAIATGYQEASGLRMDVWRADREGNLVAFEADDEEHAAQIARTFLRNNLGGAGLELLHLDIIPAEGGAK